jgi:hypothetical protein
MRITETLLRRIIKEEILNEDERRRAEMMADIDRELDYPEMPPGSTPYSQSFQSYDERRKDGRAVAERQLKRIWNKHADHVFFNNRLVKIHAIGMYAGYAEGANTCINFLDAYAGKVNRDELSVWGSRPESLKSGWISGSTFVFGVIVDGHVTYAASMDQATEWTSIASKSAKFRHAGSGLPKRPFYVNKTRVNNGLLLDEEDWVETIEEIYQGRATAELIIDNWRIKAFVVNSRSLPGKTLKVTASSYNEFITEVIERCKQYNIPIVDETGAVYEIN